MSADWLDTIGIAVERRDIAAGLTQVPASAFHRLGVHVGRPVNASCRCDGQRHIRIQSDGDIDIVPAGLDGEWEDDADCTILRLWVSPALLRKAAEDLEIDPDRVRLIPRFQCRDSRIEYIAKALAEPARQTPTDRLVAEGLGSALAVRLIDGHARLAAISARQTLSARQRNRLVEFIENHLEHNLSLAVLAGIAGISVPHLKVLFRRSFGLPVHQYVIRRRVEHARQLLADGELPISQVALSAGFAHQSHLTHAMKRVLGVTPAGLVRLRRERAA